MSDIKIKNYFNGTKIKIFDNITISYINVNKAIALEVDYYIKGYDSNLPAPITEFNLNLAQNSIVLTSGNVYYKLQIYNSNKINVGIASIDTIVINTDTISFNLIFTNNYTMLSGDYVGTYTINNECSSNLYCYNINDIIMIS